MRILTITSPRAGSGKTTTAVNLAAELAALGARVALVDLDPLADASAALGTPPAADPWNATPRSIRYGAGSGALLLCPGGRALAGARGPDVATLIERAAAGADCVIVDAPAGAGTLTTAAAEAADVHLVTLPPSADAHVDLRSTAQLRYLVGSPTELRAAIVRALPGGDTSALRTAVSEAYPAALLAAEVPEDSSVTDARNAHLPLRAHSPHSPAAIGYRLIAAELAPKLLPQP